MSREGSVAINHPRARARACRPTLGLFVHARPRSRAPARPFGRGPFWVVSPSPSPVAFVLGLVQLNCSCSGRSFRQSAFLLVIRVPHTYVTPPGARLSLRSTPTRQIVLSHFRRAGLCVRACVRTCVRAPAALLARAHGLENGRDGRALYDWR